MWSFVFAFNLGRANVADFEALSSLRGNGFLLTCPSQKLWLKP